jgi:hypothetical protein
MRGQTRPSGTGVLFGDVEFRGAGTGNTERVWLECFSCLQVVGKIVVYGICKCEHICM